MNEIEALKLLLEVDAGDNITTVATWYVVTGLVPSLIGVLVAVLLFILASRLISKIYSNTEVVIKRWRDELGIGCPGVLTDYEREQTIDAVDKLVRAAKAKQ